MAVIKITYNELSSAKKNSIDAAKKLESYASKLNNQIANKLSDINNSDNINSALSSTRTKINELNKKAEAMRKFSSDIEAISTKVKGTDKQVASSINSSLEGLTTKNSSKVSQVMSGIFQWLTVDVMNKTSFGRWVKDAFNTVKDIFSDVATTIKHWYKTDSGKYLIDIISSGLILAGAIFTIFTASTVLTLVCSIIAATIYTVDLICNIINHRKMRKCFENKDPAWAKVYGEANKLSDTLRLYGKNKVASIVDITEATTGVFMAAEKLIGWGKDLLFKSKAIKQLIGNRKTGLGKKFLVKEYNKVKFKPFDGLKAIMTDDKFRKELNKNFKKNFKKDKRAIVRFIKDKKNTFKQLGAKKSINRLVKHFISQYKSKYDEIKTFDGQGKIFKFKLSTKSTNMLKRLNMTKYFVDIKNELAKGKIKTEYYSEIEELIENISKIKKNRKIIFS